MSVRRIRRGLRRALGLVLMIAAASSARAWHVLTDPLHAEPPALTAGVTLPGDGAPVLCPAPEDFSKPLSLADAVDAALCDNPQIQAAWADIKVQAAALGEARAAYLPTLSATAGVLHSNTNYPGSGIPATVTHGNTVYGAFSWRLFDFGERQANLGSANALLTAALASHDAALQQTLAEVIQDYFDAVTKRATWQAKIQDGAIAHQTLEVARRREAGGTATRNDILQATTAYARATLDRNRAEGKYEKAVAVLTYAMGVPMQTHLILENDVNSQDRLGTKDLEGWLHTAETHYPAIIAARAQWRAAQEKVVATRSEGLPTVDLEANYYQNGYPGQGLSNLPTHVRTVGVMLTIPIFNGFSQTYAVKKARAQAEQLKADMEDTEHNVLMEVVEAYADATSSLRNLRSSEVLLQTAQASLASSQRRYAKGAASILEILNAQAALASAKQERIRSLADWRSARLRLLADAGVLGRTAVSSAPMHP